MGCPNGPLSVTFWLWWLYPQQMIWYAVHCSIDIPPNWYSFLSPGWFRLQLLFVLCGYHSNNLLLFNCKNRINVGLPHLVCNTHSGSLENVSMESYQMNMFFTCSTEEMKDFQALQTVILKLNVLQNMKYYVRYQ